MANEIVTMKHGEDTQYPQTVFDAVYDSDGKTLTQRFDDLPSGGGGSVTVDSALSNSSTNPVQNKVITAAMSGKADSSAVPTKVSQLTNDSGYLTEHQSLSAYRTSADQDKIDAGFATKADISTKADASTVYTKTAADELLSGKQDAETGKGLSTNDFTDTYKTQVDSLWSDYKTALTLIGGDS